MPGTRVRLWLEVAGQAAVIAGLVFLGLQIRQNTRAIITASGTALTDQSVAFFAAGLDNQVVARALYKQEQSVALDEFELSQLVRLQYLNFRVFENAFLQYRRGYYEETEWDRYRQIIRRILSTDSAGQAMWQRHGEGGFTSDFADEVRTLMSEG